MKKKTEITIRLNEINRWLEYLTQDKFMKPYGKGIMSHGIRMEAADRRRKLQTEYETLEWVLDDPRREAS